MVWLVPFAFVLDILMADNSWIDDKHLQKYPFCGKMNIPSIEAKSRVVNSEEPTETYRWVVRIKRLNRGRDGEMYPSSCSGSVITER